MAGRIQLLTHVTKDSICRVMRPIRMSTLHFTVQESSSDSLLRWSLASQGRSVMEQAVVGSEQMELTTLTAPLILMQRRQLPALALRRLHSHLQVLHLRKSRRLLLQLALRLRQRQLHQRLLLTLRVIQSLPQTLTQIRTRTPHRHLRRQVRRHLLSLALNLTQLRSQAHLLNLALHLRQRQLHQQQLPRLTRATLIQTQTLNLSHQAIQTALLRHQVQHQAQVRAHRQRPILARSLILPRSLILAKSLIHQRTTTLMATLCNCTEPMRFSPSFRPRTVLSAPLATGLPSISTVRPREASYSR